MDSICSADTKKPPHELTSVLFFYLQRDDEDEEEVAVTDLGIVASSVNGTEVKNTTNKVDTESILVSLATVKNR